MLYGDSETYNRGLDNVDPDQVRWLVEEGAGHSDAASKLDWGREHPIDMGGSDLYLPTLDELRKLNEDMGVHLALLEKQANELSTENIYGALVNALDVKRDLQYYLNEMKEEDKLFAHAVQDWVLTELEHREEERGGSYEQGSDASYEETIIVLDALLAELHVEEHGVDAAVLEASDNHRLIRLAEVWREETLAELSVSRLRELYYLAA